MSGPGRGQGQRMAALEEANRIRSLRSEARRAMTPATARELVARPPAWAQTWAVEAILRAIPGVGAARIGALLRRAEVAPQDGVGELSRPQREALSAGLAAVAPRRREAGRGATAHAG